MNPFTQSYIGSLIWWGGVYWPDMDDAFFHPENVWDALPQENKKLILEDCKAFCKRFSGIAPENKQEEMATSFLALRNTETVYGDEFWGLPISQEIRDYCNAVGPQYIAFVNGELLVTDTRDT